VNSELLCIFIVNLDNPASLSNILIPTNKRQLVLFGDLLGSPVTSYGEFGYIKDNIIYIHEQ
jgi:hypothetical protein